MILRENSFRLGSLLQYFQEQGAGWRGELPSQHPLGLAIPAPQSLGWEWNLSTSTATFVRSIRKGTLKSLKKKSLKQEVSKASAGNHKTWKALCVKGIQEEKHSKSPSSCLILKPRHYTYERNFCQFFSPEHITISCSPLDLPAPFSSRAINFQNAVTRPYSVA